MKRFFSGFSMSQLTSAKCAVDSAVSPVPVAVKPPSPIRCVHDGATWVALLAVKVRSGSRFARSAASSLRPAASADNLSHRNAFHDNAADQDEMVSAVAAM